MKTIKNYSKFISLVLRHEPKKHGIMLDEAGWTETDTLVECVQEYIHPSFNLTELEQVVQENNKKRFEFNSDKSKIRARQGHSVQVNLGYQPTTPPDILYHGSQVFGGSLKGMLAMGISKMKRHAVHLSSDVNVAVEVGGRKGDSPCVVVIDSKKMYEDGFTFYVTGNNVWLTDNVPVQYIIEWKNF